MLSYICPKLKFSLIHLRAVFTSRLRSNYIKMHKFCKYLLFSVCQIERVEGYRTELSIKKHPWLNLVLPDA